MIRFRIEKPNPILPDGKTASWAFSRRYTWRRLEGNQLTEAIEQKNRQRWRVLHLAIKAKIEAVEAGVVTFEEEFLAHIVTSPNGPTVGEALIPRLAEAGRLLLGSGS